MKKIFLLAAAIAALIASFAASASAVSLWDDRSSLFTDRKASTIGDIVLVDIREVLNDKDEGKLTNTKSTNENVGSGFGILDFIRSFGLSTASTLSGNTKVERKKNLSGTISCIVTDVMPNGNLVIEGEQTLISGAEKMRVTFSGVVRPMDINAMNRVVSNRVANAEISVAGNGVLSRTQRPGLISQIIQAIF